MHEKGESINKHLLKNKIIYSLIRKAAFSKHGWNIVWCLSAEQGEYIENNNVSESSRSGVLGSWVFSGGFWFLKQLSGNLPGEVCNTDISGI